MRSPYDILGVPASASDDEIKKAYRNLSRKYHPDANVNNPDKERAEERFKEVQQAYRNIMDEREGKTGGYGNAGYGGFGGFAGRQQGSSYTEDKSSSYLNAAMNYVRGGDYASALRVLSDIDDRTGRWYYISAIANQGAGNQATALEHIQIAMRMEPGNMEYQQFYHVMQNGGTWYQSRGAGYGMPEMDGSDFCIKLCLANLVCNMCCTPGC